MDDRIKAFLKELESKLTDLPETEAKGALDYYEEYLNDALDEGKSVDELLEHMDSPVKISAIIKTETSIRKAQNNPGLRNYSRVLKYALSGITTPLAILLFSVFIFITYGIALVLFCGAFATATAALVFLAGLIFEAIKIPAKFVPEIMGTAGFGVFLAGICLLTSYGLFLLCRLFIMLSSGLVGRMMNKSLKPLHGNGETYRNKGKSHRKLVKVCIIAAAVGLVISIASGLPVKLFNIFNSARPASITVKSWEFNKSDVKNINISTEHSHIRLVKSKSERIVIRYEQSDWLEGEAVCKDGKLSFYEKSNGRLPLFQFVSMHENRAEVVVELPDGTSHGALWLESRGGFVHVEDLDFNTHVKTYTGNIFLYTGQASKLPGITAGTVTGYILVDGRKAGTKTFGITSFKKAPETDTGIEMESTGGSIFIITD